MPLLRVRLLGGFHVERAGVAGLVADWQRRTAKTLTKLLATSPAHALHREQVLESLWPGVDLDSALNSLGKALHAARRALEPELLPRQRSAYLLLSDSMLALDADRVTVDADRFEHLAEGALRRGDAEDIEVALAAYGGELLPEDRYEDWCSERRGFLAELRVRLLLASAEGLEGRGAFNESADRLRAVLHQDPTREEVHRRLMRLYSEMGTPDQAARQFHLCEDALRRSLALAPQPETVSLYRDVLENRIPERMSLGEPSDPRPVNAADNAVQDPFVGRDQVLEQLWERLARGEEGGAGMAVLTGEAGVGKTRLLEELATTASRRGAVVLWGGSGAHAQQFAYGPFAVALEGYAVSRSLSEREELVQRYPALTRFVPSLGIGGPSPSAPGSREDDPDVIRAIVRLLTDLAQERPVLVVLGDLHEADAVSLNLLRYLAHLAGQRSWLMVGAVREEEVEAGTELWRLFEATLRECLCTRVELQCLSRQDVDQLITAVLGSHRASEELLQQIYLRSRGNPLFVSELVREVREGGKAGIVADDRPEPRWAGARVPARVRTVAMMRVASMGLTVRRVLELAAVGSGADISLDELRAAATALQPPVSEPALFDALDKALQTRLLEEHDGGYAFRHPLVRSSVYESLSRHRREQLHTALGRARTVAPDPLAR